MKHVNYLFFLFIVLFLSCSRNQELDVSQPSGPLDVIKVKEWYNKTVKGARSKSVVNELTPDWDHATSRIYLNQDKYLLQVPFKEKVEQYRQYSEKQIVKLPQPELVVYFDPIINDYKSGTLEVIPTFEYYESHIGTINEKDFSGKWYLRDSNGSALAGYTYKDGNIIAKLSLASTKGGRTNDVQCSCQKRTVYSAGCYTTSSVVAISGEWVQDCSDYGFPTSNFVAGMVCDNFQIISGPIFENQCWETSNPTNPPIPGGTGNPNVPTWSWGPDTYIINNLKSTCLTNVLNSVVGANYVNVVQDIVRNFSADTTIRITFEQADLGYGTYGTAHGGPNNSHVITLNNVFLQHASREIIAATIYHEILHIIIPSNQLANGEHQIMAQYYVMPMAIALKDAFPNMSSSDATALAWGGLKSTQAYDLHTQSWKDEIDYINLTHTSPQGRNNDSRGTVCN